jgi:DNA processing protein
VRKRDQGPPAKPPPLPVAWLDDAQRLACLRLIRSENVGPVTFRALVNRYGGAIAALDALPELSRRGGRTIRICSAEQAEAELAAAERIGARALFTIEPGYPPALAMTDPPPPLLYVKGDTGLFARPAVGIVGSRQASAAGQSMARQLAAGLGAAGFVVVSGLARGIDGAAHRAALDTGTVAVLAGGLDVVYPPEHAQLHEEIASRGCLVSEQPPGFEPRGNDFPRRNRIIAGIALGVVVVEAARRSGSLITGRRATEQGREVFAVPGHPLDPRAEGTNQLLKDGATMATGPDDVIAALSTLSGRLPGATGHGLGDIAPAVDPEPSAEAAIEPAAGERARVLATLGAAPVPIDEVVRATGLPSRVVSVALLELALAGRIEHHGAQMVSLRPAAG